MYLSTQKGILILLMTAMVIMRGSGQPAGSARGIAMGDIVTLPADHWASGNNPAALPEARGFLSGITVQNKFLVSELNELAFIITYQAGRSAIGLSGNISGYYLYRIQWYGLSYGIRFSPSVSAGAGLVYLHRPGQEGKPACHGLTYKIGSCFRLVENLILTFCGSNLFGLAYSSNDQVKIASVYSSGLVYRATADLILVLEVESGNRQQPILKAGMEYGLHNRFFLRMGALSGPFRLTGGAGLNHRHLIIDIAVAYHAYLGFSPIISLIYSIHPVSHD